MDQDDEEQDDEKSDCQYKIPHFITVYITLPNGDEEIITDFEMCFTDKTTKMNDMENVKDEEKAQEDVAGDKEEIDMENIEFEFKL